MPNTLIHEKLTFKPFQNKRINFLLGLISIKHLAFERSSRSKRHSRTYAVIYTKKYLITRIHSNTEAPRRLSIRVPSIHAEMNAIAELKAHEKRRKPIKGEKRLLIVRITPGGKLSQAKQCDHCSPEIVECGVSRVSNTNEHGELDVSIGKDIQLRCLTSLGWKNLQNLNPKLNSI
jgi:deoxycytidylate deaminase